MYKAQKLKAILAENKYQFNYDHRQVYKWVRSQNDEFRRSLERSHGYNRVVSMFDFDKLSDLESFKDIDKLCIVSGSEAELETNFVNTKEVFATSLEKGYDLTDDWSQGDFKNQDMLDNFDFVMCNQVLEHVPDPIRAFNNLTLITKPGGYIWVSIPVINRIHDEPNFYSSGYHPRYLKFLADKARLDVVHIGAWGSLKYKLFAVSRNWPPLRKLQKGLRSNSDLLFPKFIFSNGAIYQEKHLVDAWALYRKPL
ncbi:MAG: methyltransferase domain-containing protein [Candidatus Brocadiales bacterium]|nr:methyltransferase domain-containing protein [Candidatus Brocadiales bacterium]